MITTAATLTTILNMSARQASQPFCPVSIDTQLYDWQHVHSLAATTSKMSSSLPGYPLINTRNEAQTHAFLLKDLYAADLENLAPHLWVMSTFSSKNINPLHAQKVRGRDIIVTEDPRLHLVWTHDRIFIKPLPRYLLSHAFWDHFLCSESSPLTSDRIRIYGAALGYLRTYVMLIQSESDFWIAQKEEYHLVPANISWEKFCDFIAQLVTINDIDVSGRYSYGELRLTRLNFYAKVFLRRWNFEYLHGQYSDYFARFYGPILFMFGILSTLLSAMQVEMAVEALTDHRWQRIWGICRWFSIVAMVSLVCLSLALVCLLSWMIMDEWIFALRARRIRLRAIGQG